MSILTKVFTKKILHRFVSFKGVLLLDMRQEYNSKTEDYKDIACDIILVSNDTNEFNDFKQQTIETYKDEYVVKGPRDITGGERIEIKCLDPNKR